MLALEAVRRHTSSLFLQGARDGRRTAAVVVPPPAARPNAGAHARLHVRGRRGPARALLRGVEQRVAAVGQRPGPLARVVPGGGDAAQLLAAEQAAEDRVGDGCRRVDRRRAARPAPARAREGRRRQTARRRRLLPRPRRPAGAGARRVGARVQVARDRRRGRRGDRRPRTHPARRRRGDGPAPRPGPPRRPARVHAARRRELRLKPVLRRGGRRRRTHGRLATQAGQRVGPPPPAPRPAPRDRGVGTDGGRVGGAPARPQPCRAVLGTPDEPAVRALRVAELRPPPAARAAVGGHEDHAVSSAQGPLARTCRGGVNEKRWAYREEGVAFHGTSTIFPYEPLFITASWARGASASGISCPTIGVSFPAANCLPITVYIITRSRSSAWARLMPRMSASRLIVSRGLMSTGPR